MLAIPPRSIADAIVSLFAEERDLRADVLHKIISSRFFQCSTRAVYKELKNLVEQGVVVKVGDRYSLSISWILNLIHLSETFYTVSVDSKPLVSRLPTEGTKLRWKFHDLQHLDRLWIQLMFLMFEQSQTRKMFAWIPYFWFDLVHFQKDQEAMKAMKIAGNKMYMILGSHQFLDRLPAKYWTKDAYEWSYAESPFEEQRSTYIDVIDDLILTVHIDAHTTSLIEDLFGRVRSKADFGLLREFDAIKSNAKASLTLERCERKAAKLRKKFSEFFGL